MENQKTVFVEDFNYEVSEKGVVKVTIDYGINDPEESECLPEQRTFFLKEVLNFLKSQGSIVDFEGKMVTIEEVYVDETITSKLKYEEVINIQDFEEFLQNKIDNKL